MSKISTYHDIDVEEIPASFIGVKNGATKINQVSEDCKEATNNAVGESGLHPMFEMLANIEVGDDSFFFGIAGMKDANTLIGKENMDKIKDTFYARVFPLLKSYNASIYLKDYNCFLNKPSQESSNIKELQLRRKSDTLEIQECFQNIMRSIVEDVVGEVQGLDLKIVVDHRMIENLYPNTQNGEIESVIETILISKNALEHKLQGIDNIAKYNSFTQEFPCRGVDDEKLSDAVFVTENNLFIQSREGEDFYDYQITKDGKLTDEIIQLFIDEGIPKKLKIWEAIKKIILHVDYDNIFCLESYEDDKYEYFVSKIDNNLTITSKTDSLHFIELPLLVSGLPNEKIAELVKRAKDPLPEEMQITKTFKQLKIFAAIHAEAILPFDWDINEGYTDELVEKFRNTLGVGKIYDKNEILLNYKGGVSKDIFDAQIQGKKGYKSITDIGGLGIRNTTEGLGKIKAFVESDLENSQILRTSGAIMTGKMKHFRDLLKETFGEDLSKFLLAIGGDEFEGFIPEYFIRNFENISETIQKLLQEAQLQGRVFDTMEIVEQGLTHALEDLFANKAKLIEAAITEYLNRLEGEIVFNVASGGDTKELLILQKQLQQLTFVTSLKKGKGYVKFSSSRNIIPLDSIIDSERMSLKKDSEFKSILNEASGGLFSDTKKAA